MFFKPFLLKPIVVKIVKTKQIIKIVVGTVATARTVKAITPATTIATTTSKRVFANTTRVKRIITKTHIIYPPNSSAPLLLLYFYI